MRPTLLLCCSAAALLLLLGCDHDAPSNQNEAGAKAQTASYVPHLSAKDTLPYPVAASFDEIAPLFEKNNDTVYVINFWATWCAPCVEELPYFEQLAEHTADRPVQLLMVSLDFQRDIRTKLLKFVRERPLKLPVVALADARYHEWIDRVDPEWTGAIPITLIYKGDQRQFHGSAFANYEELEAAVMKML